MKYPSIDNIEDFLKEIEDLKAKVSDLERFEIDEGTLKSNLIPSNLKSLFWLENSPVCTKIVDIDFNLQYMSNSGITKLKIDDITQYYGKPYPLHFYSDSFKTPMTQGLKLAKALGKPVTQEASILDRDGNELWFNSTLTPIYNAKNKLDYFMIVSSDTTGRKQAEIDLVNSEEKLKEALDITNLGTFTFNDNTNSFETSLIGDQIIGIDKSYNRDAQGWINLVHPEDYESAQLLLDNTESETVSSEFRIIRPIDKRTIWILGHAKKEFNKDGIRTKITGTIQDISERKISESNLKQSELRLREAQAVAHIGSFEGDIYSDKLWWSEELFKLFGLNATNFNVTKESFNNLIHPNDKDNYLSSLDSSLKTGNSFKQEFRGIHTNGDWRYFETVAGITRDAQGSILGLRGTVQDISDRKDAEKLIRKNQIFNESLLRTSPNIIYVYDLIEKRNIYSNDGNFKTLGYTSQEILDFGDTLVSDLMHPEDYKNYLDNILPYYQKAKDGEIIEYENRIKHKNGDWVWIHSKESIFKRQNDKPIQIFGIGGDVTKRKQAEEKLYNAQASLKNTFDISPSIIATANIATGYFTNASQAVSRILGFTVEEFTSRPLIEFIHPDDRQRTNDEIAEKLKKKKVPSFENRYLCKNGSYKWIAWQSTVPDENGVLTVIGSDINDKKQIEKNLELSAERFERWKSSNFIGILQSNSNGDIVDANDTILEMLGYSKQELKQGNLDWTKLTPSEFLHLDNAAIEEAKEKGYWTPFEKEYLHKDGQRIPILIGGSLFKETQNEFIVFVVNLTESKKAEKDLKESEDFLNLTGEIAKVGGWELDLSTKMVKWSRETKSIHEVAIDYKPCLDTTINFYHPDDREMVKNFVEMAIKNGVAFSYEARINTAKGKLKIVKSQGQPVFKNGVCIRLYGAFQDITERRKIEEELEKYRLQLETENVLLKKEISLAFNYEDMVYSSHEMSDVLTQVELVANTDATVLILGETGTGKELIAKALHNTSERKNNSLIRVNCGAIPSELIESELFGHVKGAFTGAVNTRIGKFELADGGTIFLDEIGELPLALQSKLLRAIQEGEIEPIGSSKLRKLDVRIIAATNKDLKKEVEEKLFREDLFFRLNVFPIEIPPLRRRVDDLPVLIDHFVNKYSKKHSKHIKYISDQTMLQLKNYKWPGNVRELENLIERAVIISNDDVLIMQGFENSSSGKTKIKNRNKTLDEVQRDHIHKILNETNWKIDGINGAAEFLNIKPSTLRDRMKKFGIKRS